MNFTFFGIGEKFLRTDDPVGTLSNIVGLEPVKKHRDLMLNVQKIANDPMVSSPTLPETSVVCQLKPILWGRLGHHVILPLNVFHDYKNESQHSCSPASGDILVAFTTLSARDGWIQQPGNHSGQFLKR